MSCKRLDIFVITLKTIKKVTINHDQLTNRSMICRARVVLGLTTPS